MKSYIEMKGKRFGRWTVIDASKERISKSFRWMCQCDCGVTRIVDGSSLRTGQSKSCGCLHSDVSKQICIDRNTTHGSSKTKEYKAWKGMLTRCYNKNRPTYKYYGGRGIVVSEEWKNSYEAFVRDIGFIPNDTDLWSVGRIDNNDDYCKENCKWEIWDEQARNRGMQVNNTSTKTGVYKKLCGGIAHFVANWYDPFNNKRVRVSFSTQKYGNDEAFRMACERRDIEILNLNKQGAGYSKEHGLPRTTKENK